MGFQIKNIKINQEIRPLGLDIKKPLISWQFSSEKPMLQKQMRIHVGTTEDGNDVWDTGVLNRSRSIGTTYAGEALKPQTRYYVTVEAWDQDGDYAKGTTDFETGLMNGTLKAWDQAAWIGGISTKKYNILMREISLDKEVEKARLYVSARGIYEAKINGVQVGEAYCSTGISQFVHHIMYQTYDVTKDLKPGINGIGFMVGPGKWTDLYTYAEEKERFCEPRASVMAKLDITYTDHTTETIVTDAEHWQLYDDSPYQYLEDLKGERYDGYLASVCEEYSKPGFSAEGMSCPEVITEAPYCAGETNPEIVCSRMASVKYCGTETAVEVEQTEEDCYVYDFGKQITGISRITLHGDLDQEVKIRYGEKKETMCQTDEVLMGDVEMTFSPKFMIRKFRYVEICGVDIAPELAEVEAVQLSNITEVTGTFHCDDELVNHLAEAVGRHMQGGYIGVPTVCPQGESGRLWIGDTHIFAKTAAHLGPVKNYLLRNMRAKRQMQQSDKRIQNVVPLKDNKCDITCESMLIVMTWELYQQYGDAQIIRENYEVMDSWMDKMEKLGLPGLVDVSSLGDLYAIDHTDKYLVINAFHARNAALMKEFAAVLGNIEDIEKYTEMEIQTKSFWNEIFVDDKTGKTLNSDGSLCDTQGSYVLGLDCRSFTDDNKYHAINLLAEKTKELDYTVHTGFFSTEVLNKMLSRSNHHEEAYRLIKQTKSPSYNNPADQNESTNNYNDYVLGDVACWLFESVLGIKRDFGHPGYQRFILKPEIFEFEDASGGIEVPAGRIESSWKRVDGKVIYECSVPANTRATIKIGNLRQEIGSGHYRFEVEL